MKEWIAAILILGWLGWHLAVPVNLLRSDLGRHIKNGELILQGQWDILYKNYYSYTNPEYTFVNYHWLFGVFCYVFCQCSRRYSSFVSVCALSLLSFPFLSFRCEIRPEGISYLFCGLFWWMI